MTGSDNFPPERRPASAQNSEEGDGKRFCQLLKARKRATMHGLKGTGRVRQGFAAAPPTAANEGLRHTPEDGMPMTAPTPSCVRGNPTAPPASGRVRTELIMNVKLLVVHGRPQGKSL